MRTINSVELARVHVAYRKREVLTDISNCFDIGCHLIEGTNGVGKSTLLGAVAGHVRYGGSIRIQGKDLEGDPVAARRCLAYVPDAPMFYSFVTGIEFIEFLMRSHQVEISGQKRRLDSLVEQFNLGPHLANRFSEASLGTRRKFFLVAMFVISPGVLILDEPFNGLDAEAVVELVGLLAKASVDRVIMLTCHQRSIVDTLAVTRWTLRGHPYASLSISGIEHVME